MRKMMTKEVTKTTIKLAKMEKNEQGMPVAVPLEPIEVVGNVNLEKAQKLTQKHFDEPVTVFEVLPETIVYEMAVEEFIKVATIKQPSESTVEEQ